MKRYSLKLRTHANPSDEYAPQFSISYRSDSESHSMISYALISALMGSNDMIIQVTTDLFEGDEKRSQRIFQDLMDRVEALGIPFKHQKVPSIRTDAIFGFALNKKKPMAQELAAYIPNALWKEQLLIENLPDCGVLYYIIKPVEALASDSLDKFWGKSSEERAAMCEMVVFDISQFGQMGITSSSVQKEDLQKLLGL